MYSRKLEILVVQQKILKTYSTLQDYNICTQRVIAFSKQANCIGLICLPTRYKDQLQVPPTVSNNTSCNTFMYPLSKARQSFKVFLSFCYQNKDNETFALTVMDQKKCVKELPLALTRPKCIHKGGLCLKLCR